MKKRVREPIQVYLTAEERSDLDDLALDLGLSRSEVLRRGITLLSQSPTPADSAIENALVRPATVTKGPIPTAPPVASLHELLDELRDDRDAR